MNAYEGTIAAELLEAELERLERDHFSNGEPWSCDECDRAFAVKQEIESLKVGSDAAFSLGLTLLGEEVVSQILDGLDVAAADYAYRADFEDRFTDADKEEQAEYEQERDKLNTLAGRIIRLK